MCYVNRRRDRITCESHVPELCPSPPAPAHSGEGVVINFTHEYMHKERSVTPSKHIHFIPIYTQVDQITVYA